MRVGFLSLVLLTSCLTRAYGQGIERDAFSAQSVVNRSCTSCHNDRLKRGELSLTGLDADRPDPNNPMWEKAIRKVRTGMMPPAGARRPDGALAEAFAAALEASLDRAAASHPEPGRPALHRLNRTEYANSVRDILAIDVDAAKLLPPDDMTHGFDNMADVLDVSPTLMDSYIGPRQRSVAWRSGTPRFLRRPRSTVFLRCSPRTSMWKAPPLERVAVLRCAIFFRLTASIASG